MIRPASVGEMATMTRRPRATSPPRQCTVTLSAVCSISCTGTSSTMWSAISAASRRGISLVPPTKRVVWAPPSDSANSSDVTPQVWMVNSRCRKDTSTVGTARIPTVQISSSVRATGESPCAVVPGAGGDGVPFGGARCQPGRLRRDLGRQLVEEPQHALEFGQLASRSGRETAFSRNTPEPVRS